MSETLPRSRSKAWGSGGLRAEAAGAPERNFGARLTSPRTVAAGPSVDLAHPGKVFARLGLFGAAIAAAIAICLEQWLYVLMTLRRIALKLADLLRTTWRCPLSSAA